MENGQRTTDYGRRTTDYGRVLSRMARISRIWRALGGSGGQRTTDGSHAVLCVGDGVAAVCLDGVGCEVGDAVVDVAFVEPLGGHEFDGVGDGVG